MTDLLLNDTGSYRCEVVDGLEDRSTSVYLELRGTTRPHHDLDGRALVYFLLL